MIVACCAIFVGAVAQRVAGLGFAMMVAPFVVLAFGPATGVIITNLGGAVISLVTLWVLRRDVDWRTCAWLIPTSVVGVWLGSKLVTSLKAAVVHTVVGAAVFVAVIASVLVARSRFRVGGRAAQLTAGLTTGALISAAGVGGPTMSVYAVVSRWEQKVFAATMQPYFAVLSLLSIAITLSFAPQSWPVLAGWEWAVLTAAMAVGFGIGHQLSSRVPVRVARVLVVMLALIGALVTCVTGIVAL